MLIACDVDGVIADSYPLWLERYHRDHPDAVKIDLAEVYGPKAVGNKQFLAYLYDAAFYDGVPQVSGAWNGVQALRAWGHRVVFVTSCPQGQTDAKWQWLQNSGFLPQGKMQERDLVVCHDKSLIRADVIIEDTLKNVKGWPQAVLLDRPYNRDGDGGTKYYRVFTWPQVVDAINVINTELNKPYCICTGFLPDKDCEVCNVSRR